jgi:pyruvate formate lyase activating enzyme
MEVAAMPESVDVRNTPLEAASPFELRVNLGANVPETDVRTALATGDMGFLHSFTTGSAVDGPGVRVVAWTTGCMWRCLYCHNPDTWTMSNGIPVTVQKAADELRKYRQGLKVMGGGFTLSGGEPLMQHRFAVKLFTAARAMGIHTAVQTNGHYGDKLSDAELESIDLVLLDIKMWDPERHRRLTGMDGASTRAFAERLAANKRPMWVRFVLVPGLSDRIDDIKGIASFAAKLGNVQRVDVLPFHQLGRFKWKELGLHYELERREPPTPDAVEAACRVFRAEGLTAY